MSWMRALPEGQGIGDAPTAAGLAAGCVVVGEDFADGVAGVVGHDGLVSW
jgi:hypothetical protein